MEFAKILNKQELRVFIEDMKIDLDDWKDVLEDDPDSLNTKRHISALEKMIEAAEAELNTIRTQTYEAYAEEHDTTYIMEETLVDGQVIKLECIGWYCGEPNAEDTKKYGDRNYVANYV